MCYSMLLFPTYQGSLHKHVASCVSAAEYVQIPDKTSGPKYTFGDKPPGTHREFQQ